MTQHIEPKSSKRIRRFEQVANFCVVTFEKTGIVPSYSTIAAALSIYDRATVRRHVIEAERHDLLTRSGSYTGGAGRTHGQRIRLVAAA